jgi:hypothetical protein
LIDLTGSISKTMVIGNVVEELLGIKRTAQQQSKISVVRPDDATDQIDCITARESVLIGQPVLLTLAQRDSFAEKTSHTRK